jgi:hypothetical protein
VRIKHRGSSASPFSVPIAVVVVQIGNAGAAAKRMTDNREEMRITEYRIPNTEYGTRNTEHGIRNTEYGTRNTEHGIRNTEYGTRNAERGMVDLGREGSHAKTPSRKGVSS